MIQIDVIHNNINKQINYFQLFIEFGSIDTQICIIELLNIHTHTHTTEKNKKLNQLCDWKLN